MTRVQADLALGLAGLIWGFGFVAQKAAFDHIGPFTFVAARFLISALFVLPFVIREKGFHRLKFVVTERKQDLPKIIILCMVFATAVLLQQSGIGTTSVTKAAFLTGLFVVMVPFVGAALFRNPLSLTTLIASCISVLGVGLLSGSFDGGMDMHFNRGDGLVLLCAVAFALQVVLLGRLTQRLQLPLTISWLQYVAVAGAALALAFCFEKIDIHALAQSWGSVLFAGVASGGVAYTLQAVAQQHTPPADAAIIMSSEALFGGLGGVWLMGDKLTVLGILGCCAIMAAIMLVELGPLWAWGRNLKHWKS